MPHMSDRRPLSLEKYSLSNDDQTTGIPALTTGRQGGYMAWVLPTPCVAIDPGVTGVRSTHKPFLPSRTSISSFSSCVSPGAYFRFYQYQRLFTAC